MLFSHVLMAEQSRYVYLMLKLQLKNVICVSGAHLHGSDYLTCVFAFTLRNEKKKQ